MNRVELYIENRLVDLDNDVRVVINKSLIDIYDPSKIRNDFTKTISLPSTKTNDEIFDFLFDVTRRPQVQQLFVPAETLNIGRIFNPSKKAGFRLLVNDHLIHKGYVKLTNINIQNPNKRRYEVVLYGELGSFFQKFEDYTLKNLLRDASPVNALYKNRIRLLPEVLDGLYRAWLDDDTNRSTNPSYNTFLTRYSNTNLTNKTIGQFFDVEDDVRNLYIELMEAENGLIYDGDKAEFQTGHNDNADTRTTSLGGTFTEQQLALKEVTHQRYGFYIDMVIMSMLKYLGYDLKQSEFVNISNPYWGKTMFNSLIPEKREGIGFALRIVQEAINWAVEHRYDNVDNFNHIVNFPTMGVVPENDIVTMGPLTNSTFTEISTEPTVDYYPIVFDGESIDFSNYFMNLRWGTKDENISLMRVEDPRFHTNGASWRAYTTLSADASRDNFWRLRFGWRVHDFNNPTETQNIWTNEIRLVGNARHDISKGWYQFKIIYGGIGTNIARIYVNTSESVIVDVDDTSQFDKWVDLDQVIRELGISKSIPVLPSVDGDVGVTPVVWVRQITTRIALERKGTAVPQVVFTDEMETFLHLPRFTVDIKSDERILQGSDLKYFELIPDVKALDFFLSYIKMFGLIPDVDEETKEIRLLTRNEYYGQAVIKDFTNLLDRSREYNIIPLNFNDKYIDLTHKDGTTYLARIQREALGREYGSARLLTGYEFNEDIYKLFGNNFVFENSICVDMRYTIFGYEDQSKVIPYLFENALNKSQPSRGISLFFHNGPIPADGVRPKYISDADVDNGRFWIWTGDNEFQRDLNKFIYNLDRYRLDYDEEGRLIMRNVPNHFGIPEQRPGLTLQDGFFYNSTIPYHTNFTDIEYSLDFFLPRQLYFSGLNYPESATIYNRFWQDYLGDRYNVNTRVLTGYFYLSPSELHKLKFSDFIYLDGSLWSLNKIIDYDITSNRPVKLELVTVHDIANYSVQLKEVAVREAEFIITDGVVLLPGAQINIAGQTLFTVEGEKTTIALSDGIYPFTVIKNGYITHTGSVTMDERNRIVYVLMRATIVPAPEKKVVTFLVRHDGDPVENALISIAGQTLFTMANGYATIELEDDTYPYTVNKTGFLQVSDDVVVDGSNVLVEIDLDVDESTLHTVKFIVTDGTNPLENTTIDVTSIFGSIGIGLGDTITTDENGIAEIILPNGDYSYTTSKPGYHQKTDEFTVLDDNLEIHVRLVEEFLKVYSITFNVVNQDDDILQGVEIEIGGQTLITNSSGQAIVFLPADTYSYSLNLAGYTELIDSIDLTSNTILNLTLFDENYFDLDPEVDEIVQDYIEFVQDNDGLIGAGITDFTDPTNNYDSQAAYDYVYCIVADLIEKGQWDDLRTYVSEKLGLKFVNNVHISTKWSLKGYDNVNPRRFFNGTSSENPKITADGIEYDGINDFFYPVDTSSSSDRTIVVSFKVTSLTEGPIWLNSTDLELYNGLYLVEDGGDYYIEQRIHGGAIIPFSTIRYNTPVELNNYYHVVFRITEGTPNKIELFVNGNKLSGEIEVSSLAFLPITEAYLGGHISIFHEAYFTGIVNRFKTYTETLSDEQIEELYDDYSICDDFEIPQLPKKVTFSVKDGSDNQPLPDVNINVQDD